MIYSRADMLRMAEAMRQVLAGAAGFSPLSQRVKHGPAYEVGRQDAAATILFGTTERLMREAEDFARAAPGGVRPTMEPEGGEP